MNLQLAQDYDSNKFGLKIVDIETSFKIKFNKQWLIKKKNFILIYIFLLYQISIQMRNKENFSRVPIMI